MLLCDTSHIDILHIHTLASYLGMLDEPHEGRDVGAKPKDGVGGPIDTSGPDGVGRDPIT
jgi:hypothetical protein